MTIERETKITYTYEINIPWFLVGIIFGISIGYAIYGFRFGWG